MMALDLAPLARTVWAIANGLAVLAGIWTGWRLMRRDDFAWLAALWRRWGWLVLALVFGSIAVTAWTIVASLPPSQLNVALTLWALDVVNRSAAVACYGSIAMVLTVVAIQVWRDRRDR